ncbi:MAG: DNA-3-methyladenine glycosylase I [Wenzhouxiangellaceae bacterium]
MSETKQRCAWCGDDPLYVHYHDTVWGWPERNSKALFAKLCLDGQQAGLSWITILRRQSGMTEAYAGFDPVRVARFDERDVARLLADPRVIRNRQKINSVINNARAWCEMAERGIDFSEFLWEFVDGRPIQNAWRRSDQIPVTTPVAEAMSKTLKKHGFSFCGPVIVYAFMQAVGMVNDHLVSCPQHASVRAASEGSGGPRE